jgi:hypothetical protein
MAININIEERSYGGKRFRPTPVISLEKSNNFLICVTPWGPTKVAEKVIESIQSFVTMANEDTELTIPYARKENLQQMGNVLRMAVIMASEKIFNQFNGEEYTAGFEIFAAIQEGPQWIYVSCGQPSLIIRRKGLGLFPLTQALDLNVLTSRSSRLDPLPNALLGLGQNPPLLYGNIRLRTSDQLALVSRTSLPSRLFQFPPEEFTLESLSQGLATDSQEIPFWLGLIHLD